MHSGFLKCKRDLMPHEVSRTTCELTACNRGNNSCFGCCFITASPRKWFASLALCARVELAFSPPCLIRGSALSLHWQALIRQADLRTFQIPQNTDMQRARTAFLHPLPSPRPGSSARDSRFAPRERESVCVTIVRHGSCFPVQLNLEQQAPVSPHRIHTSRTDGGDPQIFPALFRKARSKLQVPVPCLCLAAFRASLEHRALLDWCFRRPRVKPGDEEAAAVGTAEATRMLFWRI